jgi:hypothetical protein
MSENARRFKKMKLWPSSVTSPCHEKKLQMILSHVDQTSLFFFLSYSPQTSIYSRIHIRRNPATDMANDPICPVSSLSFDSPTLAVARFLSHGRLQVPEHPPKLIFPEVLAGFLFFLNDPPEI